jgi:hypothetical protein
MKTCSKCGALKAHTEYYRENKTRRSASCKTCHNAKVREWQAANRDKVRGYVRKACKKAYDAAPEEARAKSAARRAAAPDVHKERVKRSYQKMQANLTEHEIERRKRNSTRYRAQHLIKIRAAAAKYRKRHPAKHAAQQAKRRAVKLQATPAWLTNIQRAQLQEFYDVARARTVQTGVLHHVDHIEPLKGDNARGLHVPWNLQILTAPENISKSNRRI